MALEEAWLKLGLKKRVQCAKPVNKINDHVNSIFMSAVNKSFEVLRSSEPARDGKEVRDVIAKTSVICVLHNSHDLDAIVSELFHPRNN